jgi:hypothetical protein
MFRKNSTLVILMSGLFLFISAPISNADVEGVVDVDVVDISTVIDLVGDGGIIIDIETLDADAGVNTFASFDPQIGEEFVPDPENYVLTSSGILLTAAGGYNEANEINAGNNTYGTALIELIAENNVTAFGTELAPYVVDLGAVSFDFTAGVGHNTVSLDFILASGEHYEGDYDIAGIFINGINYAYLPNANVLRVNSEAQITNVCSNGGEAGCFVSDYSINGGILGTISPRLTMYAPINPDVVNTFSASVANTSDNILPSYLLLSNFYSFAAAFSIGASAFTFEGEIFDFGIQLDEGINVSPSAPYSQTDIELTNQSSEITGISISTTDANNVTIIVTGKFIEKVLAIDVNDRRVLTDAWEQTSTSITLTVPAVASGIYAVQIWNGSFPTLQSQTVLVTTK